MTCKYEANPAGVHQCRDEPLVQGRGKYGPKALQILGVVASKPFVAFVAHPPFPQGAVSETSLADDAAQATAAAREASRALVEALTSLGSAEKRREASAVFHLEVAINPV